MTVQYGGMLSYRFKVDLSGLEKSNQATLLHLPSLVAGRGGYHDDALQSLEGCSVKCQRQFVGYIRVGANWLTAWRAYLLTHIYDLKRSILLD